MYTLIIGSLLLSLLHAIIPNHWLPVLAIGRKEGWNKKEVLSVTFFAGLGHVMSTLMIGWAFAFFGWELAKNFQLFTSYFAPAALIIMGTIFIYRHHTHHHFHVNDQPHQNSKAKMILALSTAMFFSPCLEIEGYFLAAGTESGWWVIILSLIYFVVTLSGMLAWVNFAYTGVSRFNWHALEHKAGIITGIILIITGILTFFIH